MKAIQFIAAALGLGSYFRPFSGIKKPGKTYPLFSRRECFRRMQQAARNAARQAARQARHAEGGAA